MGRVIRMGGSVHRNRSREERDEMKRANHIAALQRELKWAGCDRDAVLAQLERLGVAQPHAAPEAASAPRGKRTAAAKTPTEKRG